MSAGRPQIPQGFRIGPCEVPRPLCQRGQKRHQSGAQCLSCLDRFLDFAMLLSYMNTQYKNNRTYRCTHTVVIFMYIHIWMQNTDKSITFLLPPSLPPSLALSLSLSRSLFKKSCRTASPSWCLGGDSQFTREDTHMTLDCQLEEIHGTYWK